MSNITCYSTYNTVKVSYTLEREFNKILKDSIKDKTEIENEFKTKIETETYIEKKNKLRYLYWEYKSKKVLFSKKNNII